MTCAETGMRPRHPDAGGLTSTAFIRLDRHRPGTDSTILPRLIPWLMPIFFGMLLSACGGGGGGSADAAGGIDTADAAPVSVASNVQAVRVEAGPANGVNLLYTSITFCQPGNSAACETIDDILVDTGSTGLRVLASVLPASLRLPQQTASNAAALVECAQFADGNSWGPVKTADVMLGNEMVRSLPIQIIGDPAFPEVPFDCSSSGPSKNTVRDFGSNGILGIGNFMNDCGRACAQDAIPGTYYACDAAGCAPASVSLERQVRHPVSMLARNNNGVLLRLPAVPDRGAPGVEGSMVFGIGTESNNRLGAARVYGLRPQDATLTVSIGNVAYENSFIDSGSNGTFFPSSSIPVCRSGFYCPAEPQNFATVLQGTNGNNAAVAFTITNADALFAENPRFTAFPTLGAPDFGFGAVDFGLPFFFGRTVFTAIEDRMTPGGNGPYVAF